MIALATIGSVLWRVAKISIPVPLALIAAGALWWQIDKSSAVRKAVDETIEDITNTAQIELLKAKLAEQERQRLAAELARAGLSKELADLELRLAAADTQLEQEIADYEKKLADAGRSCRLDDADIEWLRQP